jgi:hypothetical protein
MVIHLFLIWLGSIGTSGGDYKEAKIIEFVFSPQSQAVVKLQW